MQRKRERERERERRYTLNDANAITGVIGNKMFLLKGFAGNRYTLLDVGIEWNFKGGNGLDF